MDPHPIPFSSADLERRRLESTINQDLHSLSLASGSSSASDAHFPPRSQSRHSHHHHGVETDTSFSSLSTIEYPRAAEVAYPSNPDISFHQSMYPKLVGPHGTPRAANRKVSQMSERSYLDASPVSTAGHHVSAVTLAEGVFKRAVGVGKGLHQDESGSEWDPDRSLGRLVGELGKAMKNISPRPSSPFSPPRSPRSPSPYTTQINSNLSFTLNRNDPLPSPPASRHGSGSGSSAGSRSRMASAVPAQTKTRRPLGDTTVHNITQTRTQNQKSKPKVVQDTPQRPASAPTRLRPHDSADVTGMTGLLDTPAKGLAHGSINKNGNVGDDAAAGIPGSLATLHARLRALETENSVSRRRVRELEVELERAKEEVETAKSGGQGKLQEIVGEKTALEELVKSLRTQLSRITVELEHHKSLVTELRQTQTHPPHYASPGSTEVTRELVALRQEVERLGNEVHRLGGIVEQGLETRKKARGEETIRLEGAQVDLISLTDEDVERAQKDVEQRATATAAQPSKLRQALHRAGSPDPQVVDATFVAAPLPTRPTTRSSPKVPIQSQARPTTPPVEHRSPTSDTSGKSRTRAPAEGPSSPFPSIREEDEVEFFEVSKRAPAKQGKTKTKDSENRRKSSPVYQDGEAPPQTVLMRVIGELEADFKHYKAIYCELADQYKILDAASVIAKRHILAEHLKEVIGTLEQKADQIASLYDLLSFKDQPNSQKQKNGVKKSVPDILRMVKESLGEEGLKRLQADGNCQEEIGLGACGNEMDSFS